MTAYLPGVRAEAEVDHASVRHNTRTLREAVAPAHVMAVVKADGYGHGAVEMARSALAAGATWLSVALLEEALALRQAGLSLPILFWLAPPRTNYSPAVEQSIDVGVSSVAQLREVLAAAALTGHPARVHLKIDTGLHRNGAKPDVFADLVARCGPAMRDGRLLVVGIWSHLACADEPTSDLTVQQLRCFDRALAVAARVGIEPQVRHIANSAAALSHPAARYDLVRSGIALTGLSPGVAVWTPAELGLRPAMTVRATLSNVKAVGKGAGVAYVHSYRTPSTSSLGLVPVGYADGIPYHASNRAEVQIDGTRYRIAGTVAMDQFIVDLGATPPKVGAEVVVFGPGDDGEPTAGEWAEWCATLGYEIVTRLGVRLPRRHVNIALDRQAQHDHGSVDLPDDA